MAAGEYIKTAAANMFRAANTIHQQVLDLQSSLTRIRAEKKSVIDKSSLELKTTQAEQTASSDQGKRSMLSSRIQKLQDEIMSAEKEIKQAEADIQSAITAKTQQANSIESQARQLETQASTVD